MEPITVIIPTYNRPDILMTTVSLLRANLQFAGHDWIFIGDDGDLTAEEKFAIENLSYSIRILKGPGKGLGANLNFLLAQAETDIVLQMDDDHQLVETLDITQFVKDLRIPEKCVDWIRLMVGEEKDVESLSTYYKFSAINYGRYWMLSPYGPELYLPSNRPHLKRVDFHETIGYYQEDVKLGKTETAFCHQYKDYMTKHQTGRPSVAIPMELPKFGTWAHVGESWQKKGL